jgi:hypothetical protein
MSILSSMRGSYKLVGRRVVKKEKETSRLHRFGYAWSINLKETYVSRFLQGFYDELVYVTPQHKYSVDPMTVWNHGYFPMKDKKVRLLGGEVKLIVPAKFWRVDGKPSEFDMVQKKRGSQLELL